MTLLMLASTGRQSLSQAHQDYLRAAIERYRQKSRRALKLAQAAIARGNTALAAGLIDESTTFHAMANDLAAQQLNITGEQR